MFLMLRLSLTKQEVLLEKWIEHASVLVIDEFPVYMPRRIKEIAVSIGKCEVHAVDSNGFISLRQDREFTTAYSLGDICTKP